jgi:hypothetical protein
MEEVCIHAMYESVQQIPQQMAFFYLAKASTKRLSLSRGSR